MNLDDLKLAGEAPNFLDEAGLQTLRAGYLLENETPKGMYHRVAKAAASYYSPNCSYWESKFFDAMWNNWLCPATPVLSNMGTSRGLSVSCNTIHPGDSVNSIFDKVHELAMLSKNGAGVGIYLGDVRGRGAKISGNGQSEGIIPWAKVYDAATLAVSQGSSRRGSTALYLPIDHPDAEEFIDIRKPTGDANRRCMNLNNAVCITDSWMSSMLSGDKEKQKTWIQLLTARVTTGEPYIFFSDTVNKSNPDCYKFNNLEVKSSNLCSEITLFTDPDHTFVCCLSSLNLARWEEWKDTDVVITSIYFLDAVLQEYIDKAKNIPGMEKAVASAEKGRALGLGVLGWHSLLQSNMLPFDSFDAMKLNASIFKKMRDDSEVATKSLAHELGEPEWCVGFKRRNTHLLSVAPTVSNSTISGGLSGGIEPFSSNYFSQKSAKGTFIRKNKFLENLLTSKGQNTDAVWKSINTEAGSVQHLDFLSQDEREVFKTAREIDQFAIIRQAAQRQKYIDQAQSLNLFFHSNASAQYIHDVHVAAWSSGVKTLYYLRSEGVQKGDVASRDNSCKACEG